MDKSINEAVVRLERQLEETKHELSIERRRVRQSLASSENNRGNIDVFYSIIESLNVLLNKMEYEEENILFTLKKKSNSPLNTHCFNGDADVTPSPCKKRKIEEV